MSFSDDTISNSFSDTERLLDNFISEGQMILSRAYESRLKAESEKAFGNVAGDLVSEGIKHFVGIPKKYTKPFMKRKRVNDIVDEALVGNYNDWLGRLNNLLETVSVYSPKIRKSNSSKLVNRLSAIDTKYVHIDTRLNHAIPFLNSLRNKQTIFNNIIPKIVKARKENIKLATPRKPPSTQSVNILDPIKKAMDEMVESVRKYVGRSEQAFGYISETIVKIFYEQKGYNVEESTNGIDQQYKIDLIATRDNEVLLIQVKKGQIANQEITEVYHKASELMDQLDFKNFDKKIILVARRFPENYLSIRDTLLRRNDIDLLYLHSYQIFQKIPKKFQYLAYEK